MVTKNYRGKNTGMQFMSAVGRRRAVGSLTQSSQSLLIFVFVNCERTQLVSLPVFLPVFPWEKKEGKKSFVARRWGS